MFSVNQVAEKYSVSSDTVLSWLASGQLKGLNVGRCPGAKRPRWRITQAALDAFEAVRASSVVEKARRSRGKSRGEVVEFYKA